MPEILGDSNNWYYRAGTASNGTNVTDTGLVQWIVNVEPDSHNVKDLHPQLYFKYVKSKLGLLERKKLDGRLKALQAAFLKAVDNGQEALGDKLLTEISRETKESLMFAKGITRFIEIDEVLKYKNKIKGGHISDTDFKLFTRVIPKDILKRKKEIEHCFEAFVIYHYWNPKAKDVKKMEPEEKAKMRDPILFGRIKESNRLYFIAEWEDEYCDLTFDEMVEVIGETKIKAKPEL